MCDGWTDSINHKHIMNFLVYSSKGTIFTNFVDASNVDSRNTDYYFQLLNKIVGEEYVIQIVTDNERALKVAGQKLMEKIPHLYWFACSTHYLDLCLEDIGKKKSVQKSLEEAKTVTTFIYNHIWTVNLMKKYTEGRQIVRPDITRFATKFLQLQAIVDQKQGLNQMFNSEEFKKSKFYKQNNGPTLEARKIVLDHEFWSRAIDILKVFEPIVKVLRLMDGDTIPTIGFLYEAIDRAKQSIQKLYRYHSQYNDIVDKRWKFMHSDLHSTVIFFSRNSNMELNMELMSIKKHLMEQVINKSETFGTPQAEAAWSRMNPVYLKHFLRWMIFGSCSPELHTFIQRKGIKLLNQTTSATNCERIWSTLFIQRKGIDLHIIGCIDLSIHIIGYNMKLKMRTEMRRSQEEIEASFNLINLDNIFQEDDPLSEWIEERENSALDGGRWF
ncbi:hypothetical protein Lal_00039682 [Lupinus albus]|nr:hypothetical protein Lal_00039682 [Lupinus albus]